MENTPARQLGSELTKLNIQNIKDFDIDKNIQIYKSALHYCL